jgi:PhnB protein
MMSESVSPVPARYRSVIPYLNVRDAAAAIDFYKHAFGAQEATRFARPGGKVGHAELLIGDALFMLREEYPELDFLSPESVGGTPINLLVYVEDVDVLVERAKAAGAAIVRGPEEQFHGDRMATIEDPFGHSWFFATHMEDIPPEELAKRAEVYEPSR